MNLTEALRAATAPSPWRIGNSVLYDLCRTQARHTDQAVILAKVWLIGRSYAAAIERRREKAQENDDFYVEKVGPAIAASKIDLWIRAAKRCDGKSPDSRTTTLAVHYETTQLFNKISGLEKRSLASKYLHFHLPNLFFIFDSRAVKGIGTLKSIVGRANRSRFLADPQYRNFSEKCITLQRHLRENYGADLTPREIDNFLLYVHQNG